MEEMNQEGDATQIEESSERRMSRFAFGIVLIIVVACIWVGASEWIQWIFGDLDFQKPYFMTFFNTTGFCFYNLGFVLKSWRRIPWKHDAESARLANAPLLYSISELWRCALMFCPLWFAANSLFNFSLAMTSVASNTILSSTSSIWTLVMSRVILGQPITIAKVVAVALVIGGSCLVATTDDGSASHSIAGDMVALLSAFFYGAYTTILKWCLPDEKKYNMGMVFGFVGVANLLLMWPGIIALDLLKVEQFEFPPLGVLGALSLNALIGTNLSDVLWAKSVILTSPLVATLGLSLTTPLAMIADFSIHGDRFSPAYVVGAALVVVGFTASSIPWDQIAVPWRDTRSTEEVHDSDGIS
ncbi:membrane-associated protein, putative [Bodo saltans]|uniref:Membrane-associated protein, putative n=1 Tax=Bodo saltans TaxID=75058 RepID=A0A0S4IZN0_BODSA|nr:membrane-associated protein, putative [Bodo saltans]|eukprot:CUF93358.1 membrane-associated protein, putative [Bodo saltans]